MVRWLWVAVWAAATTAVPLPQEVDSEQTRKLLGESVVTSVSVIMDHGNGSKTYLTDNQEQDKRPQVVGTPGTLLAPDRYEFYSFGEDGELVKKLMSLEQIQSLIAGGSEADELEPLPVYYPQPLVDSSSQTEGVSKVLETVQNLLKGELQAAKVHQRIPPVPLPDHSWSILLPGLINSDLDFKDASLPVMNEPTPLPTISNDLQTSKIPSTTTQKRPMAPSTTTKYTTPNRPTTQSTLFQKITMPSTTYTPESTTTKKTATDSKYNNNHITPAPITKTTGHLVTKQSQRPLSTTKRPYMSTKKPYVSDSPYAKIPLMNTTKPDTTTKATTTSKRPVVTEERNPSTKMPEVKKPLSEKQKPSGIPSITHYLPISSSSSSNSSAKNTTPSTQESTTVKQKVSTATKESLRVTTTKRPTAKPFSPQPTVQKLNQTTTRKPIKTTQSKPPSYTSTKTPSGQKTTTKVVQKTTRPTTPTPQTTKVQTKPSTVQSSTTPTTTKAKPEVNMATGKPNVETTSTTAYQLVNTTIKQTTLPNYQKLTQTKKPQIVKPLNNLIPQSSNVVNSKIRPSTASQPTTATRPITTQKTPQTTTSTTTPPPERITTFSYTSKVTSTGEIITSTVPTMTTQQKITTGMASSTLMSSTHRNNYTVIKTTEKPLQKITQPHLESVSNYQTIKGQSMTPTFHKPTTYHPQNFHSTSKKPVMQNTPSGTTSFPTSVTFEALKLSSSANILSTQKANVTSKIPPSQTSFYSVGTTQAMMKPTTELTPDGTTMSPTTLGLNLESTHGDSSTFSTDDMPLQEIPLKIYESLKDNIAGPQDIMTTIMNENMQTTTGKIESTYSTMNAEDTTLGSTMPVNDKTTTTITTTTAGSSTVTPQVTKVVVTNKPPNQTMAPMSSLPPVVEKNEITDKDSLQGSASMPVEQIFDNNKISNSSTTSENTIMSTTDSSNVSEANNSETSTNIDSTTIYKDHILQEGISAVTSILLDETQSQQAMKEAMLASAMKDKQNKEKFRTTTENEPTSTTVLDYTEMQTLSHNTEKDEMKSEVRLNEDNDLPEKVTTEKLETTTIEEKTKTTPKTTTTITKASPTTTRATTTTPKATTTKVISNEHFNKAVVKKNVHKPLTALPTKESKLNPDNEPNPEMELSKIKPNTESSLKLRATVSPDVTPSTERVKLSDYQEKSVPKPINTFPKKPNPVYQPLESLQPPAAIELHPAPYESMGLEASIAFLGEDVRRFADLCNELAFRMWTSITGKGQISSRSLVMSPFAVTSLLAMVFLGARGPTSGQMNDVLRLDDMVTFNPHQVLQNVTDSVINSKNYGVATAAFVRELYSDKGKGKILDFYKERVQQYYQGHVEEVTFTMIGDIIRRRTNLLVKRQTLGKVPEYLRGSSLNMRPPLAAFSANIFQTDCEQGSTDGRDGEMYFVVRPSTRQRRLVPVPAVVWRSGFLAGYEPSLDATSICLGAESSVSTILILPGQQGQVAPGDGLARLEQRLIETSYRRGGWSRVLRSLMPRPGLELQIPRFSHRSVLNITGSLQRMGLRDLFNNRADLRGLNGLSNDLHLSDMLQVNTFSTCGEETIGARHHVETYPASPQRMGRDDQENYPPRDFDNAFGDLPLSLRPRQARLPDNPRLRFDRPFLYMVRHNPSGMILHMGRFNPRLLP